VRCKKKKSMNADQSRLTLLKKREGPKGKVGEKGRKKKERRRFLAGQDWRKKGGRPPPPLGEKMRCTVDKWPTREGK